MSVATTLIILVSLVTASVMLVGWIIALAFGVVLGGYAQRQQEAQERDERVRATLDRIWNQVGNKVEGSKVN